MLDSSTPILISLYVLYDIPTILDEINIKAIIKHCVFALFKQEITAPMVAESAESITNELLSRMGHRLNIIRRE